MEIVGIRELKTHLSQYILKAKQGERVIISEHNHPVVFLQKITANDFPNTPKLKIVQLAQEGIIEMGQNKISSKIKRVKVKGKAISKQILEERR